MIEGLVKILVFDKVTASQKKISKKYYTLEWLTKSKLLLKILFLLSIPDKYI